MIHTYAVRLTGNHVLRLSRESIPSRYVGDVTTTYMTAKDEVEIRTKLTEWDLGQYIDRIKKQSY